MFGLPVLYLLFQNVANLAIIGSIMIRHGHAAEFWGLILPHGMLELTAVFVAGGVGLRLFWSWVEPGDLTRAQSFAHEGRTAGTVALGLVGVLAVSGVIEAFVTPSPLPTWARIAIGVLAEATFLAYVFVLGRRAARPAATPATSTPSLLEDRVAGRRGLDQRRPCGLERQVVVGEGRRQLVGRHVEHVDAEGLEEVGGGAADG